jgi:hypothetical protein
MVTWLAAFAFTQCIEVPIYMRAMRGRPAVAFGASAITHPIVWFVVPRLWVQLYLALIASSTVFVIRAPALRYAAMVLLAECFAVVIEALYLRAFEIRRAFAWSLFANGASVTLGLLSRTLSGWP